MRKKLRILVITHEDLVPPDSLEGYTEKEILEWKAGYDVITTLRAAGHEVRPLGVFGDLSVIRDALAEFKPHICFNLLEEFHGVSTYDQHVIGYLELMKQPYTGCNPRGLMLAHDKALSKKVLSYHRIKVPGFTVYPRGRKVKHKKRLRFPLFVKSLVEEGSYGIAQASLVHNEQELIQRVAYLHEQLETHAIAEEYIEGREIYCGVIGNRRLRTLPLIELRFGDMPAAPIATYRVKWDWDFQAKHKIETVVVNDIPEDQLNRIYRRCRRIYRALSLSGYARIDLRLTPEGDVYVLEANPNADISEGEEFASAAEESGLPYPDLLQRVLALGLRYQAEWRLTE